MSFDRFFKQVGNDWQQFGLMGIGPLLIGIVTSMVMAVISIILMGPGIFAMIRAEQFGGPGPGDLFAFFGSFAGFFILALAVGAISGGLSYAGLVGSVVGYRRGERASLGAFWQHATRHFGKMVLLGLIVAAIMLVAMLLSAVLLIIPPLGILVMLLVPGLITLNLGLYPAYLIIAEDRPVTEAVGIGFRLITSHFVDTLLGTLIFWGFLLATGAVAAVPVIGWIVTAVFAQPLITYFFIDRFELEVRPKLQI